MFRLYFIIYGFWLSGYKAFLWDVKKNLKVFIKADIREVLSE